jgi:hypothetical protein
MKKLFNPILFTVAIGSAFVLLTSCEGGTTRIWSIHNASTNSVQVRATVILNGAVVDTVVAAGRLVQLTWWEQRGGSGSIEPPTEEFSQIVITNPQMDTATIAWQQIDTWQVQSAQLRRVPSSWEHTHLLVVTDSLFQ